MTEDVTTGAAIPFDPTTPAQRENPFDVLALARREEPVFYAPALDLWVVTRHEDVLAVLKDHRTFSSTGALKSSSASLPREVLEVLAEGHPEMPYIIELDPPLHDRIRGLVTGAFTPRRIAELEPRIESISSQLIGELAPSGRADIVEVFAWPLPLRVLGELFGFPRDDLEQIHRWGLDWLLLQQERPLDEQLAHARGLVALQRYCVAAVEDRRVRPSDDLLGALVAANDGADDPLGIVEVAGLPLDLMVAGHVTVTRAIGSVLDRMFTEPELRAHLLDPERAPKAIEEILRLESPRTGPLPRDDAGGRAGWRRPPGGRPRDGALRLGEPGCVRFRPPRLVSPGARRRRLSPRVRQGDPLLHRGAARPARAARRPADAAPAAPGPAPRPAAARARARLLRAGLHLARRRVGHVSDVVIVTGAAAVLGAV